MGVCDCDGGLVGMGGWQKWGVGGDGGLVEMKGW